MTMSVRASRLRVVFLVLVVSVSSYTLLQSLVTPVLTEVERQLGTDQSTATWVLSANLLSASVATPIIGRIGDSVGKKKMLVVSLLALAGGSLLAALATSIGVLIFARVIQGIGAGVLPLAFGIIRDEFPDERTSSLVGFVASISAVGGGAGIAMAGPIVDAFGYPWLFWLPMIVTSLAAVAASVFLAESTVRQPGRVSLLPAVLLSMWLICLLIGVSEGNTWGWTSPRTLGLFAATVVAAAAWVRVEHRSPTPLIDLDMMRLPAVWTTNLVTLIVGFVLFAGFVFGPQFSQTPPSNGYGFGASITESGLMLLPTPAAILLVGPWAARLARAIGPKYVMVLGCLLAAASTAHFATTPDHRWEVYLANTVNGAGFGLVFACTASLIVVAVRPEQTGVASGMNANIRTIGGAIGAAVMASIVTSRLIPGSGFPRESSYVAGFTTLTVIMLLGVVISLTIPSFSRVDIESRLEHEPAHPGLGIVPGGTVVGDKPE